MDEKERSRRRLWLLITPIVVLSVAATVATALTPALATRHPLLLITLEPRMRNLVLARHVDLLPFLLVAVFRRMLTDPLYFLLGHYYGDAAVRWLEEKLGWGPLVRVVERFFAKASYPMVFIFPGAIVCALAGAAGMSFGWFVVLNLAGTIFSVMMIRLLGDLLSGPVDWILGLFGRYTWQLTAVTIALVGLSVLLSRLEGKMMPSVSELEAELEAQENPDPLDADGVDADRADPDGDGPGGSPGDGRETEREA